MSVWEWRLDEFRDRTAAGNPTPGGGSVAAVAATLGLGLVAMAMEVTGRREEDEGRSARIAELLASAHEGVRRLSARADEDIAAFDGYMDALRLPKATEEEKAARSAALRAATVQATESPLAAAGDIVEALGIAAGAAELSSRHIISDVAAGVHLLAAGAEAVLLNVDINVGGMKDEEAKADYIRRRTEVADAAAEAAAAAVRVIADRIT